MDYARKPAMNQFKLPFNKWMHIQIFQHKCKLARRMHHQVSKKNQRKKEITKKTALPQNKFKLLEKIRRHTWWMVCWWSIGDLIDFLFRLVAFLYAYWFFCDRIWLATKYFRLLNHFIIECNKLPEQHTLIENWRSMCSMK